MKQLLQNYKSGELRVEERRVNWDVLDAWREAAIECGIPAITEFNRGDNFGVSYFQMNQRRGARWSATKGFLRPVLGRPNLSVIADCMVERIIVESGHSGLHSLAERGGDAAVFALAHAHGLSRPRHSAVSRISGLVLGHNCHSRGAWVGQY